MSNAEQRRLQEADSGGVPGRRWLLANRGAPVESFGTPEAGAPQPGQPQPAEPQPAEPRSAEAPR